MNDRHAVENRGASQLEWRPKVQVPLRDYGARYEDYETWVRYFWQIKNVTDRGLRDVLEIGVGSSVVSSYLLSHGVHLTTLDIDAELRPSCAGSITELPFGAERFDAVMCCEVLEHMPFEQTRQAIQEIHRVTRQYAFVSTPLCALSFAVLLRLPVIHLRELRFRLPDPRFRLPGPWRRRPGGQQHYWECGLPGYPVSRLRRAFLEAGFHILSEQKPPTNYSNCFFVLEKRKNGR